MNQSAAALDLSKYIDTEFFGEHPHIRGRRIPVVTLIYAQRDNNYSVADLMHNFTLGESEVLAALLYYSEHKDEIDAQQALEQAAFDANLLTAE